MGEDYDAVSLKQPRPRVSSRRLLRCLVMLLSLHTLRSSALK